MMLRISIFLLLIISNYDAFPQSYLRYGGSVSADLSHRTLTNHTDTWGVNELIISNRNDIEKVSLKSTFGFNFKYCINKKLSIGTGLMYSIKGYNWKGDFILSLSGGTFESIFVKTKQYFHYLEIPLIFAYSFTLNSVSFLEIGAGAVNCFYLQTNTRGKIEYENGDVETSTSSAVEFNRFMGMGVFNVMFMSQVSNSPNGSLIGIGPEFKFAITPLLKTPIREHLYSIGFKLTYQFQNKKE